MPHTQLHILQNPAVAERVSNATRTALELRAHPPAYTRFLDTENFATLQTLVDILLPQDNAATGVDLAEAIDRRLAAGTNAGWRFAALPADGEAYRIGLTALQKTLAATPMKTLDEMPRAAQEAFLRTVANGDADAAAHFPLSTFLRMVRTDVARMWMSHPSTMQALNLYSFADGTTGMTDGPTAGEGWPAITPDTALPFEHGTTAKADRA